MICFQRLTLDRNTRYRSDVHRSLEQETLSTKLNEQATEDDQLKQLPNEGEEEDLDRENQRPSRNPRLVQCVEAAAYPKQDGCPQGSLGVLRTREVDSSAVEEHLVNALGYDGTG